EQAVLAEEWDSTFRTVGFCLLSGYEELLPDQVISDLRREAAAFFALPVAEKLKAHEDGVVGYLGPGEENVAATLGASTDGPDLC
ncbi:unnamed protein product, partial [Polarella glacialis]